MSPANACADSNGNAYSDTDYCLSYLRHAHTDLDASAPANLNPDTESDTIWRVLIKARFPSLPK